MDRKIKYAGGSMGRNLEIGDSSRIDTRRLVIGNNVSIGKRVEIYTNSLELGDYTRIGDDVKVVGLEMCVGNVVNIGSNSKIENIRILRIGDETYLTSEVWIEASLSRGGNSYVDIGRRCLICQGTRINAEEPVSIGDYVGIGQNVSIWTHGYHPDRLYGMPGGQGPVFIGDRVWLIAGSTVNPGVSVGSYSVIGAGSLVNKNIPEGSFAGGLPAKVLREGVFPKQLSIEEKGRIIDQSLSRYQTIMRIKGITADIRRRGTNIFFYQGDEKLIFDENTRTVKDSKGREVRELSPEAEDFRDFMRSQAIGYWTGRPFRSILPKDFRELNERVKGI